MSIEATESLSETLDISFHHNENTVERIWNGRTVSINYTNHNPNIQVCGTYLGSVYENPELPSPFCGYFDSEAKKQNEFDLAIYQYHVRCNNEESKRALESAFERMATGLVGVVIGVMCLISSPLTGVGVTGGAWMIYNCKERIWQGIEDFKYAMETAGTPLDEVRFVTWSDDYKRNTDELMKNSILEPWKPLPTPNYHYNENPHYTKPLDSWSYA